MLFKQQQENGNSQNRYRKENIIKYINTIQSLPTRERGLKQQFGEFTRIVFKVAPYAGAWIETDFRAALGQGVNVAPYAGAWIETLVVCRRRSRKGVAPYAGAWIET